MPNTWYAAFEELKNYVIHTPSIEIKTDCITVPDDARSGFYRLLNTVCHNFIKDYFPEALNKSSLLSQNWKNLSSSLVEELKLQSIDIYPRTRWFLSDPVDGLMRALFDPLFNVFQGKKDLSGFEKTGIELVETEFNQLYRLGYQHWVTLSIIKLMKADQVLKVVGQDSNNEVTLHDSAMGISVLDGVVPDPVEADNISFVQQPENAFLVAKIIIHSKRLNTFVAFRPDFFEAPWAARSKSNRQEWLDINDLVREFGKHNLWPDLAIYFGEAKDNLALIADYQQIARPDMIIECRETNDWYQKEGLDLIKRHYNALKPRLGSFVVCCEPVSVDAIETSSTYQPQPAGKVPPGQLLSGAEATMHEPRLDIHILGVNYDMSRLEPIFDAINRVS